MSKLGIEGSAQKGMGSVKETLGKALGDEKLQVEGVADKAVGATKETVGQAQDAIHKATR